LNHWLYWIILRRALVVDVCTPQIRDIYEERLGLPRGKVHVVDNAVNCDVFNPRYPTDGDECVGLEGLTPIVGYIGNRPLTRGGQHLVAAAPFLREHFPSIGVLIVGGSDREARSLMDMATREGISECCMILPRVDYEMVPRYMALLDVGVALDEPARAALIGNASQKIRQYLATGLPVVGSVDGNVFLEAEGLGTLTKGDDQDEFIHAIAEWLGQNNDARAKHAARARQYAEKELSIGKAVRSRLRIWEDALRASAI
jgi:glycosyltransferase involved in cell wall biosynthesis